MQPSRSMESPAILREDGASRLFPGNDYWRRRRPPLPHDFFGAAGPAGMREVEHHAVGVAILGLVERVRRRRPAGQIAAAGFGDLLLRFVEIVDPHAEM